MQWMQNPKYARKKAKALAKSAATRRKNARIRAKIAKQLDRPSKAERAVQQARAGRGPLVPTNDQLFAAAAVVAVQSDAAMNHLALALGRAALAKVLAQ